MKAISPAETLKKVIISQIEAGQLKKGDRLLSEKKMLSQYKIGFKMIRQALEELEAEGIVIRKARKGTFISDTPPSFSKNVACLEFSSTISSVYHAEILAGAEHAAQRLGYSLQLFPLSGLGGIGKDGIIRQMLQEGKFKGVLLLSWIPESDIEWLRQNRIHVVASGFEYARIEVPTVIYDVVGTLRLALSELTAMGHKDIGLITGSTGSEHAAMTKKMMKDVLSSHNPGLMKYYRELEYTHEDGYRMMAELLALDKPPTAVIVSGNMLAIGAILCLHNQHASEKVVVFPLADRETMLPRPMIKQPVFRIGEKSMEMLDDLFCGRKLVVTKSLISSELIR